MGASDAVRTAGEKARNVKHVDGKQINRDRWTASVSESCENGHFIYLNSSVNLAEKQHAGLAFVFIFVFQIFYPLF